MNINGTWWILMNNTSKKNARAKVDEKKEGRYAAAMFLPSYCITQCDGHTLHANFSKIKIHMFSGTVNDWNVASATVSHYDDIISCCSLSLLTIPTVKRQPSITYTRMRMKESRKNDKERRNRICMRECYHWRSFLRDFLPNFSYERKQRNGI